MAAGNVSGNRQTKANATPPVGVARRIQPHERLHRILTAVLGDAGAVILYGKAQPIAAHGHRQIGPVPIAQGIAHQILQRPRHGLRPHRHLTDHPVHPQHHGLPGAGGIVDNPLQQRDRIGRLYRLGRIPPGEGQKFIDQPLHLGDIGQQIAGFFFLGQHGQPQPQSRQRGCADHG